MSSVMISFTAFSVQFYFWIMILLGYKGDCVIVAYLVFPVGKDTLHTDNNLFRFQHTSCILSSNHNLNIGMV